VALLSAVLSGVGLAGASLADLPAGASVGERINGVANPTSVTLGGPPVTLMDRAYLQGATNPSGTITFTLIGPGGGTIDTEHVLVSGNGYYSTPYGFVPGSPPQNPSSLVGTYQWNVSYGADPNNSPVSDINDPNDQVVVSKASPTLTALPNPTSITLGGPGQTLRDQATLEGGANPSGTITFTLIGPGGGTIDTEQDLVSGNGSYSTPYGFVPGSPPQGPLLAGTYQWNVSYGGDNNNNSASDTFDSNNQVTASKASPTLTAMTAFTSVTLGPPQTVYDTANLQFGANPSGTITFTLLDPNGTTVDTEQALVSGNGSYGTP
jgi:hypothetical protein